MKVTTLNDVKVYNLTVGKTLPEWLSDRKRRALVKDEEYRRRIELIQDFNFQTSSQRIKMSPDGNYVFATGVYPPSIKVYDVQDLSLKFERRLDCEVVQFQPLSDDFGKLAFLLADRTVAFHAPYGAHYAMRIPKFGRDMAYHKESCELYFAASGSEIYRLNLDLGRFSAPLAAPSEGWNCLEFNPVHQLLGVGGEDATVAFWDPRTLKNVATLDLDKALAQTGREGAKAECTSLAYGPSGLTMAVGSSTGHCLLFDIRSEKPMLVKDHQYGLPVIDVKFHRDSKKVISTDAKIAKIWDQNDGKIFTNIETPADINDVAIVEDHRGDSGLLLMAGEQEKVMSYYVPELGPAPKWCTFLDNLTEELEEEDTSQVYDDYVFITKDQLSHLALEHMIGTPLLKAYMHGFFVDARLYNRVRAVAEPMAYKNWQKERLQAKIAEKKEKRITIQKKLPKVNAELADKLLKKAAKTSGEKEGLPSADNPLGDDRFAAMFTSKDFEVDEDAEEYRRLYPNAKRKEAQETAFEEDSDDNSFSEKFRVVSDDDSSDEGEEDDIEVEIQRSRQKASSVRGTKVKRPRLYELETGETAPSVIKRKGRNGEGAERQKARKLTLAERVKNTKGSFDSVMRKDGSMGLVREMTFTPKASKAGDSKRKRSGRR